MFLSPFGLIHQILLDSSLPSLTTSGRRRICGNCQSEIQTILSWGLYFLLDDSSFKPPKILHECIIITWMLNALSAKFVSSPLRIKNQKLSARFLCRATKMVYEVSDRSLILQSCVWLHERHFHNSFNPAVLLILQLFFFFKKKSQVTGSYAGNGNSLKQSQLKICIEYNCTYIETQIVFPIDTHILNAVIQFCIPQHMIASYFEVRNG